VCKQLFIIEVLEEEEVQTPPTDATDPTISIHALMGITPHSGKMMQLHVDINDTRLLALLDFGSTHNFVDLATANRAGIKLGGRSGLKVAVANGDRVHSSGCCRNMSIVIGNESFIVDCYGLALGSYKMVLGVQWLESLGPMLWDFTRRLLSFVHNGHQVCWATTDAMAGALTLLATEGDIMEDLLLCYEGLFATPTGLPPQRSRCHQIRLLPGTPSVVVRPYRYAHGQKAELERQCIDFLRQWVIRPSSSACSAPVLLVKKGDETWRLCVDYRALNSAIVKDKFLIPVVEKLLDELRGIEFFTKLDLRLGYHQVRMHGANVEKTAFRTHQGLFEFLVMSFSLMNAPTTFQALMNDVLWPFLWLFVLVFFYDILIYSPLWLKHLRHINLVWWPNCRSTSSP
jgi:hypothetical protein